jgi:hypothetical protein
MATLNVPIRIKRGDGPPTQLRQGELAFDQENVKLYIGSGTEVNGFAPNVVELTTPPVVLEQLADISVGSGAADGDVLVYDGDTGDWVAQAITASSVAWDDVTSKPTFATVATTGDYDDLTGKPTSLTPTAHKASHATGGADALTPADIGAAASSHTHAASDITSGLATVATTGAYADLSGTPTLGTAAASASTDFVAASAVSAFGENLISEESAESARTTLGLGSAAQSATSAFAAATHSHAWSDITSGVPSTFTPSAHSHTVTLEISGFIESPEAKTYVLSPAIPAAITITQFKAQTSAGTVDLAVHDDGTLVTGCSLADAGTTLAELASAISESVAAGSKLALVVSDLQSSPADLAFTIHYTVTSANNT